MEDRHYRIL